MGSPFKLHGGIATVGVFQQDDGVTSLQSGLLTVAGPYTLNAGLVSLDGGTLSLTAALHISAGARLVGAGSILGTVFNAGEISVGGDGAVGLLSIQGSLTQLAGSTLRIELSGTSSSEYDRLTVSGSLSLAGTLRVDLLGGFVPSPGDVFSPVQYGSRNGAFDAFVLPPLPGAHFEPQYDDLMGVFRLGVFSSPPNPDNP